MCAITLKNNQCKAISGMINEEGGKKTLQYSIIPTFFFIKSKFLVRQASLAFLAEATQKDR
jgi:hypothetical protein